MELFKLLGTIAINNTEANKALDETTAIGNKTQSKLSGTFEKIGSVATKMGKAVVAGVGAGTVAIGKLTKDATQAYADFEQLKGGIATLFGTGDLNLEEYAAYVGKTVDEVSDEYMKLRTAYEDVILNSFDAFERAGLSENEYMETVTSFSASLIQSLGGDTQKAAKMADQAIVDMSDNANKMGTSMEMIQNAYQGFAKQNYTMLDNLKLGYGGTKNEMQRLLEDAEKISGIKYDLSSFADLVDAIHVIQDEMGITGTTAKEASETISGSLGMVKAQWKNLLTYMGDEDYSRMMDVFADDFADTLSIAAKNLLPRLEIILGGITNLISALAPKIAKAIPVLVDKLLPPIVEGAITLINGLVDAIPAIISALTAALPSLINGVMEIITSLMEALIVALPEAINILIDYFPMMLDRILEGITSTLPALIRGLIEIVAKLCEEIPNILEVLITYVPDIILMLVDALIENLPILIEGITNMVLQIVAYLPQIISALIEAIPQIIAAIIAALVACLPQLFEAGVNLLKGLLEGMVSFIVNIPSYIAQIFQAIWDGICSIFGIHSPSTVMMEIGRFIMEGLFEGIKSLLGNITEIWNTLKEITTNAFSNIKDSVLNIWDSIKNGVSSVLENLKSAISNAWESIKDMISTALDSIKNVISNTWDNIKNFVSDAMEGIRTVISDAWDSIRDNVSNAMENIHSAISDAWEKVKDIISNVMEGIKTTISNAWDNVKSAVSDAISEVKTTVSSGMEAAKDVISNVLDGIREKFSSIFEGAKNIVSDAINKIKGMFNFEWRLPHIKLPHFSIDGEFSLMPPSIPRIGVEWYDKAVDNPMIMDSPTIFGYNSATGQLMGGGETESEVVSGTDTLMGMIREAVNENNYQVYKLLENILSLLSQYIPEMVRKQMVLDTGALVGELAEPMHEELGKIAYMRGRRN